MASHEKVKAQRDQLREALEGLSEKYEQAVLNHAQVPAYKQARAALKATEEVE